MRQLTHGALALTLLASNADHARAQAGAEAKSEDDSSDRVTVAVGVLSVPSYEVLTRT